MARKRLHAVTNTLRRYLFLSPEQQQEFDRGPDLIRAGLAALTAPKAEPPKRKTGRPKQITERSADTQEVHS